MDISAILALVHLHDDGGVAGRMVDGRLDEEKIGTHRRDADAAVLILTQDTVRSTQVVPASAGFHVVTG